MKKKNLTLLMMIFVSLLLCACGEEKNDLHFGDVTVNKFSNPVYDLTAELNEDWVIYSENEILEYNGYSADDVILESDVKVGDEYVELIAYDYDSLDGVRLYSKKIEKGSDVDFESIAEEVISEQSLYLESVEYTDIDAKVGSIDLFGKDRYRVDITAKLDGEDYCFSYIYVQNDEYLLTFMVTSSNASNADSILSAFELE